MSKMKYAAIGLATVIGLGVVAVGGAFTWVTQFNPNVGPAPEITIEATPEMLERGEYLVTHVAVCLGCHSSRDIHQIDHPLSDLGAGGFLFDHDLGFPGVLTAKNITPAGIGEWTDGELLHALTTGQTPTKYPLFPLMPWENYRQLATSDLHAMIAFIRTLEPVERDNADHALDPPLNLIVHMMPRPATLSDAKPEPSDEVAYGKYLLTAAACNDCHTQMEQGERIAGMEFAGGFEFKFPGYGVNLSANITPDKATGIGSWSKETFVNTFRKHLDDPRTGIKVEPGGTLSVMPWAEYAGMTEADLGAIYAYLQTVPPVEHKVAKWTVEAGVTAIGLPDAPPLPKGIFSRLSVGSLCDTFVFGMEGMDKVAAEEAHAEIAKRAKGRATLRGAADWDAFMARMTDTEPEAKTDWLHESIKHHGMDERCAVLTAKMASEHAAAAEGEEPEDGKGKKGKKGGKKGKKGKKR